eukprot:4185521-Pyramimonas_sp.AAC.1
MGLAASTATHRPSNGDSSRSAGTARSAPPRVVFYNKTYGNHDSGGFPPRRRQPTTTCAGVMQPARQGIQEAGQQPHPRGATSLSQKAPPTKPLDIPNEK